MAADALKIQYTHDGSNSDIGELSRTVVLDEGNTPGGLARLVCEFIKAGPNGGRHVTAPLQHELGGVIASLMFGGRTQ
jgi:hypothetical protein